MGLQPPPSTGLGDTHSPRESGAHSMKMNLLPCLPVTQHQTQEKNVLRVFGGKNGCLDPSGQPGVGQPKRSRGYTWSGDLRLVGAEEVAGAACSE